jgi:hypothetical protein
MKRLYSLVFALSFLGCSHSKLQTRICGNQPFLQTLAHSSLGTGRGDNLVFFTTHQGRNTNEYFLQVEGQQYSLRNDSLEYASPITKQQVPAYVAALRRRLDSLNIRGYEGEPDGLGTLMVLYMKDGSTVFRTQDVASITHPETLANIKRAEPLCEGWYRGGY